MTSLKKIKFWEERNANVLQDADKNYKIKT